MRSLAWSLLLIVDEAEGPPQSLPREDGHWVILRRSLTDGEVELVDPDFLILALAPTVAGLPAWLARFRAAHPKCLVALLESQGDRNWYRAALHLGVDELLIPPGDEAAWKRYLGEQSEALAAAAEQERFLDRLEHNTHALEKSRRHLAEMLLKSYEDLGRVHGQLARRLEQLSILYQLGRDLSLERNWDHALDQFLKTCVDSIDFRGIALLLWSFDETRLSLRSGLGLDERDLDSALSRLGNLESARRRDTELLGLAPAGILAGDALDPRSSPWDLTVLPLVHGGEAQGYLVYRKDYATREALGGDLHFLKTVQTLLGEELANAKAIQRLKRLGELHKSVLESVPAAVLTVDGLCRISYRNPQAALLFGEKLREGMVFRFDGDFHLLDGDAGSLIAESWTQREARLKSPADGEERRLLLSTTLLPLRHESDPRCVMVCEDLTEHKRLEAQLRRAERLSSLGQLSAGMAHEIRNPLAGIAMTAQVLESRLGDTHDARPFLERIQQEIQRLERIVSSLLDLSRPALPECAALDLREAAASAMDAGRGRAAARGVILEDLPPGESVWAWADRDQVHQVLLNLLLNAIEACGRGDRVGMRLAQAAAAPSGSGRIQLTVFDSGPGVPEAIRERLFDPFFTTKAEGTGLGLSICQKIMEEHGGQIRLRPRAGGGTEAILDLAPAMLGKQPEEARP